MQAGKSEGDQRSLWTSGFHGTMYGSEKSRTSNNHLVSPRRDDRETQNQDEEERLHRGLKTNPLPRILLY